MKSAEKETQGLLIVNTGNGKGKTTAAFGTALRAAGWGQKVLIIQFIKGAMKTGEKLALKRLSEAGLDISLVSAGRGMIKKSDGIEKDAELVRNAWAKAESAILGGTYDLVVLDEINIALKYKLLDISPICGTLEARGKTTVILTGRDAAQELIDISDTVSEINEVKHAYRQGVKARKGIEF